MTIGDVTVALGNGGNAEFFLSQDATVNGTGDASIGARTIGDISMTVGDNGKTIDFQ